MLSDYGQNTLPAKKTQSIAEKVRLVLDVYAGSVGDHVRSTNDDARSWNFSARSRKLTQIVRVSNWLVQRTLHILLSVDGGTGHTWS